MTTKLLRQVKRVLDDSGLNYEMIPKTKHVQVKLEGELICTVSKANNSKDTLQIETAIRRRIRLTTGTN